MSFDTSSSSSTFWAAACLTVTVFRATPLLMVYEACLSSYEVFFTADTLIFEDPELPDEGDTVHQDTEPEVSMDHSAVDVKETEADPPSALNSTKALPSLVWETLPPQEMLNLISGAVSSLAFSGLQVTRNNMAANAAPRRHGIFRIFLKR